VHSMRGISRAKMKTIKLTVVVIACYVVCSSPFICAQLWATWDPNAMHSPFWSGMPPTQLHTMCLHSSMHIMFARHALVLLILNFLANFGLPLDKIKGSLNTLRYKD
jgi:hypothetical protein